MARIAATRGAIPPNPTSEDNTVALVRSRYQHSENAHSSLRTKVKRWYDLYRGYFGGRQHQRWRNDVHLPLVFSTIQSDVSRKLATLFGQWPYMQHYGGGPEDEISARKADYLISAQLKDCQAYKKCYDFLIQADTYGTGITMDSWRHDEEMLAIREQVATPITQQLVERVKTEKAVMFDGPNFEVIDILDAFPQPGIHDIDEMEWFIHRYWLDLDEVRALENMGVFDGGATRKIDFNHKAQSMRQQMDEKYTYRTTPFDAASSPQKEDYARPVEIWEMWGRVPSEFIPADEGTQRVISIANSQVLLRNRPNPYHHGRIPFKSFSPMRDPHYFFGPGKAEVSEKMQVAANRLACQKLDSLDLYVDGMWYGNRMAGIDQRKLHTRPGGVIWGDLPPREAIERLVPDLSGVQNAYQEIEDLWRKIQQATGMIEDTVMGMGSSKRQTAHEFQGRQENISVRLLMEVRMCEEMWFEPTCTTFRALDAQFLDVPHERRIIGMDAITDRITGEPIQDTAVSLDELRLDQDVRSMGSTQVMSKFERQQSDMALLSAVGSHPAGMGMVNWLAFFREMFINAGKRNVNELLNPPVSQNPMIQAGQMAAGGGGVPSQAAQGGENPAAGLMGMMGG